MDKKKLAMEIAFVLAGLLLIGLQMFLTLPREMALSEAKWLAAAFAVAAVILLWRALHLKGRHVEPSDRSKRKKSLRMAAYFGALVLIVLLVAPGEIIASLLFIGILDVTWMAILWSDQRNSRSPGEMNG